MKIQKKLADARARFSEVVQKAMLGKTVERITAIKPAERVPGTGKGIWMAPDFDAPLSGFGKYM